MSNEANAYTPRDHLAKLLERLAQLAAAHDMQGFVDIHVETALRYADTLAEFVRNEYRVKDDNDAPAPHPAPDAKIETEAALEKMLSEMERLYLIGRSYPDAEREYRLRLSELYALASQAIRTREDKLRMDYLESEQLNDCSGTLFRQNNRITREVIDARMAALNPKDGTR